MQILEIIKARKAGRPYSPRQFYFEILQARRDRVSALWSDRITRAMDAGDENDVKKALAAYLVRGTVEWEMAIYTNSVNWL